MKKGRLTKPEVEYIIENMNLLPVSEIASGLDRTEKSVSNCINRHKVETEEKVQTGLQEENFGAGGLKSIIELVKSKEGLEAIVEIVKAATGQDLSTEKPEPVKSSKRPNLFVDDGLLYQNPKDKTPDYVPTARRSAPRKVELVCNTEAGGCGKSFTVVHSPNLPEIYRCEPCLSRITKKGR